MQGESVSRKVYNVLKCTAGLQAHLNGFWFGSSCTVPTSGLKGLFSSRSATNSPSCLATCRQQQHQAHSTKHDLVSTGHMDHGQDQTCTSGWWFLKRFKTCVVLQNRQTEQTCHATEGLPVCRSTCPARALPAQRTCAVAGSARTLLSMSCSRAFSCSLLSLPLRSRSARALLLAAPRARGPIKLANLCQVSQHARRAMQRELLHSTNRIQSLPHSARSSGTNKRAAARIQSLCLAAHTCSACRPGSVHAWPGVGTPARSHAAGAAVH